MCNICQILKKLSYLLGKRHNTKKLSFLTKIISYLQKAIKAENYVNVYPHTLNSLFF